MTQLTIDVDGMFYLTTSFTRIGADMYIEALVAFKIATNSELFVRYDKNNGRYSNGMPHDLFTVWCTRDIKSSIA